MIKPSLRKVSLFKKTIVIIGFALMTIAGVLFMLEKLDITHFIDNSSGDSSLNSEQLSEVESIDSATAKENAANSTSTTGTNSLDDSKNTNQNTANNPNISIIFSAAGQDTPGGPIIIRTILENATSGTCQLSLAKGSTTKSYSADIVWLGNYYSCDGFNIDVAPLLEGEWTASLKVTTSAGSSIATELVKVSKS